MSNAISRRRFIVGAGLGGLTVATGQIPGSQFVARADHDAAAGPVTARSGPHGGGQFGDRDGLRGVGTAGAASDEPAATPEGEMAMPSSGRVLLARSTDGGVTFGEPVVASGEDTDVVSYVASSPLVVIAPDGAIYPAYQRNVPHEGVDFGQDLLRLARSTDDGQSFAPAVDVSPIPARSRPDPFTMRSWPRTGPSTSPGSPTANTCRRTARAKMPRPRCASPAPTTTARRSVRASSSMIRHANVAGRRSPWTPRRRGLLGMARSCGAARRG